MLKFFLSILVFSTLCYGKVEPRNGFQWETVKLLAIQERGRVKPLDTFARESMQFLTGKLSWNGIGPTEFLFSLLFRYEDWENEEFVRIDYGPLKEKLGLNKTSKYFSPRVLGESDELKKIVRSAAQKEQNRERLDELEKKAIQVQNQRGLLDALVSGVAINVFPTFQSKTDPWFSLANLSERSLPYPPPVLEKIAESVKGMIQGYVKGDPKQWNESSGVFADTIRKDLSSPFYPTFDSLKREVHFNYLRPFRWSWILYASAFVLLLSAIVTKSKLISKLGVLFVFLGVAIHTYGFVLRCLIAARPPVSNMYESVLWVAWGCVVFGLLIWAKYRRLEIPAASVVFAVVSLVLADNVPMVLDPSIHPLEPVLRSNFWLTIHVLTITLSYAAFALSLCVGNVVLGVYLFKPTQVSEIQHFTLYMYRAMQIGVILLAAGTILGGVWADYSWGRFWGWDPKEVWALIALLLYIAVLHGRFAGWLKGFGFVATTVVSFLGVLMAWYGVNFVLGVGLHSYGFGSGGMSYVLIYVTAQVAFILAAYRRHRQTVGSGQAPSIFPK